MSISTRVQRTAYRLPTSRPRIRYFGDYVTSANHNAKITTSGFHVQEPGNKLLFFSFIVDFLVAKFKKTYIIRVGRKLL